jgi:parallel beta-helix repeat protein
MSFEWGRRVRSVGLALGVLVAAAPASATVWEVNAASGTCSDAGPGDATQPFCTIGRGAAVAVAGDTVNVAPALYREQVKPAQSGTSGFPITFRATGPGAVVLGTEALTGPWTATGAGTAFARSFAPASPPCRVVLVDGVPLFAASSLGAVVPGSFFFDAGTNQLTVDLGGDDPGLHAVEAGSRSFGFDLQPRSWIVVQGFEVRGQNTTAIRTLSSGAVASANNAILDNRTAFSGAFGILVDASAGPNEVRGNETAGHVQGGIRVRDAANTSVADNFVHDNAGHGIRLTNAPDTVILGNTSVRNGDVAHGVTESTGIDIDVGSDRARVQANVTSHNADTGIEVTDADDALVVRNLSYANGDHGFDVRDNAGTRLISNTSYGNHNDGISVEGQVASVRLANNLSVENGVLTGHFDLYVDASSAPGFVGDYDLVWNSGPQTPISFGGALYSSLAALNAAFPAQEAQGVTANPNFLDPAGGDFHPGIGPAIDSADASVLGFEALDLDGMPPLDLPSVANTGAGVPNFADRGALEYQDTAPSAQLRLSRPQVKLGDPVTANGSRSQDDFGIATYRFAWGDGTADTVQTTAIATHVYAARGRYKITLTVTDTAGFQSSQSKWVRVR